MTHQDVIDTLKNLPLGKRWATRQALAVVQNLDRPAFALSSEYAEAVTAGIIGHRWEAVAGKSGYDTLNTLPRWLGVRAEAYGHLEILFDVKTQRFGVGYTDKVLERFNKATQYYERRHAGHGVINGLIFHTSEGMFFQPGIDHEGIKPQFGKRKRPIIACGDLPGWIDGRGGILPAILLTSKITWDGAEFDGLGSESIREVNRTITRFLTIILVEVGMKKVQKHLDGQADKALDEAIGRTLAVKRAREIVAKRIGRSPKARDIVLDTAMEHAPEEVAERVAETPQVRDRVLETAVEKVEEEVADKILAKIMENMTDERLEKLEKTLQKVKKKRSK